MSYGHDDAMRDLNALSMTAYTIEPYEPVERDRLAAYIEKLEAERDKAEEWGAAEAKLRYEWQQKYKALAKEVGRE